MTKAVSNREICFIKAVLLFYEHEHFFSLNFAPSPNTIRVNDKRRKKNNLRRQESCRHPAYSRPGEVDINLFAFLHKECKHVDME